MNKRVFKAFLVAFALVVTFSFINVNANAKVKKVTRNQCVLKGASIILTKSNGYANYTIAIKNKGKIKVKKIKNYNGGGVKVTGKKVGKATVTLKTKKKHYVYNINILDIASTDALAREQLEYKKSTLANVKSYAFADFNGDGVTDLYADGFLYAYNYKTGSIKTVELDIIPANVSRIFVSKKKKTAYFEASKDGYVRQIIYDDDEDYGDEAPVDEGDVAVDEEDEEEFDYYRGDVYGVFCIFDEDFGHLDTFFNCETNCSIYKYTYPQEFVPKKEYKEGTDYYCFHDEYYDQDDYWYEPFTFDGIEANVDKHMPGKKEVQLVVRE